MAKIKYTWKDIDISLEKKSNGDINDLSSLEAVKSSIYNIIQTLKGSRRMFPEFASNLWEYIFEPMDEITAQSIGEETLATIEKWEDRVIIENVNIEPDYHWNLYRITVNFRLINSSQELEQIETILERG